MKVISTEVGIEMAVTIVERTESRNTKITTIAKIRPSVPSTARFSSDFSTKGAWSNTVTMVTAPSFFLKSSSLS